MTAIVKILSGLALLAGSALVLALVFTLDRMHRLPRWRDVHAALWLLRLDAAACWRCARRWVRARWCHWRQHWRTERPSKCQGPGYRCFICGTWWPDLVAAGVVEEHFISRRKVDAFVKREAMGGERLVVTHKRLRKEDGHRESNSNGDTAPGRGVPAPLSGGAV